MIHLITYGDKKYEKSKQRLYNEAKNTNWFNSITLYGPENLDNNFKNKFNDILNMPRGAGYWIWKSHIIKKKLNEINDNDILIYLDAGCSINEKGKKRLDEYVDMLNKNGEGIISFQMPHIEKNYTTKEIFTYFDIDINSNIANSGQFMATIIIMKKNINLINIFNLNEKLLHDNYLLITDYYNKNQPKEFIDNRHDQSILSIIRKIHGSIILNDETWFGHNLFGNQESLKYPFWATRKI